MPPKHESDFIDPYHDSCEKMICHAGAKMERVQRVPVKLSDPTFGICKLQDPLM